MRMRAIPAFFSSVAIHNLTSYSFPSMKGPTFIPGRSISGLFLLATTLTGMFSNTKSASLMAFTGSEDNLNIPLAEFLPKNNVTDHYKTLIKTKTTKESWINLRFFQLLGLNLADNS